MGEFGRSGPDAARQAFPLLKKALPAWQGKHAKLVLEAMAKVQNVEPALELEITALARSCLNHDRANVRRLAQRLVSRYAT